MSIFLKEKLNIILSPYAKRLTISKELKKGEAAARNKGISLARGEIVACIDQDCVADRNWLSSMARSFEPENVMVVAGEIKAHKPKTEVEVYYEELMGQKKNLSFNHPFFITANVAFRKTIFEKAGLFDNEFSSIEDVEFSFRLQDMGYGIKYEPGALVRHKNIKTKSQLFKKIFFRSFYIPKVMKKHLRFLKRKGKLQKINTYHYKMLMKNIFRTIVRKHNEESGRKALLNTIFLSARKLGLLCGSVRHGFLYV